MEPQGNLKLVRPCTELEDTFMAMVAESLAAGEPYYRDVAELARRGFAAYVRRMRDWAEGKHLPAGHVPCDALWLVLDGAHVVGESRLRHRLSRYLRREGGHIGYNIRVSERRKGYGTRILALTLTHAKARGLRRVLVTCDTENVASARIIEKNGGVLQNRVISRRTNKSVNRYWIDL